MKRIGRSWVLVLAASSVLAADVVTFPGEGEARDRSYRSIVDRNPFGVSDPPPPPAPPPVQPTNTPPKGTLKLTGLGIKGAFFEWTPEKPTTTNSTETFMLAVNQKRADLEILSIDHKSRAVKVNFQGKEKLMNFITDGKTNAVAGAVAMPLPGMPGVPGMPGALGLPGTLPGGGVARPGMPQPITTGLVTPNTATPTVYSSYSPGTVSPNAPATPSLRSIPSRQVRTAPTIGGVNTGVVPGQPQQPALSPEQQVIMMEAQRMLNPGLPPTPGLPPPPLPGAPQ